MELYEKFIRLANTRRFIATYMPGLDVMEDVRLPSPESEYEKYDFVVIVRTKEQKEKLLKLFEKQDLLYYDDNNFAVIIV